MIAAVFLLVGLAALGAFMVNFSNTQHITSAQDVQGSRAYWAAHAGIMWAVRSIVTSGAPPIIPRTCPAPNTIFPLDGFTLTVTCARVDYLEGARNVSIFTVMSIANAGGLPGDLGYVERSLSITLE